jgi:hypothetical protein
MTTTYHKFTGKCQWAKVTDATKDLVHEKYSIDVFLDGAALKAFNALKLRNKIKMTDEGAAYVSFTRKFTKTMKGELVTFSPPVIYDKDEKVLENDVPLIGNGSVVSVKISVYETMFEGKPVKGHRLEAVKIIELVEFVPTSQGPLSEMPF